MHERHDIAAHVPPSLQDSDDALTRYGRWAMDRTARRSCGSAESMYRPSGWQAVDRRRAPAFIGMRMEEALVCQRALARVPDVERIVLAILYIPRRLPAEAQLRILRIPPRLSQLRHLRGLRFFDNYRRLLLQCGPPDTVSEIRAA